MYNNNTIPTECPCCGASASCDKLDLRDKSFAKRNGLSKEEASVISEDGEFLLVACKDCGYAWIPYEEFIPTSRLRSKIYELVIDLLAAAKRHDFEDIADLIYDAINVQPGYDVENIGKMDEFQLRWNIMEDVRQALSTANVEDMSSIALGLISDRAVKIFSIDNERQLDAMPARQELQLIRDGVIIPDD